MFIHNLKSSDKNHIVNTKLYGCDISLGMISEATKRDIYDHVFVQDLDNHLPSFIKCDFFDLVVCCGVTEMLKDVNVLLGDVQKILKKSGRKNTDKQLWITFQLKTKEQENNEDVYQGMNAYTIDEIKTLLQDNGFSMVDYKQVDNAYYLPRNETELLAIPFVLVKAYHT